MSQLIWIVYVAGLLVAFHFWGTTGRVLFAVAIGLVIVAFRRPLVLALTRLSASLGLMRGTIDRMPLTIHLTPAAGPTEAARPLLAALTACKFVEAGVWDIKELPQIHVALMVHPAEGMFAAVESASSIGAHVNIHTLYPDGKVFSVTNTELPIPRIARPDVKRAQFPRSTPAELVKQARAIRPPTGFRPISAEEAPRVYEKLYADEIRFRKGTGA